MTRSFETIELNLTRMQTFLAVARSGSLAGAARRLNYAPSTVTLHIQNLEAAFGLQLFVRGKRKAELTEAGRVLQERAATLMVASADLSAAMSEVAGGSAGAVTIASIEPTASLRLPAVVASFCAQRPAAMVVVKVAGTNGVAEAVMSGEADFGVCSLPSPGIRLNFEPLFREPLGVLLPDGYMAARRSRLTTCELSHQRLLVTEEGCAYRAKLTAILESEGIRPQGLVEFGSLQGIAAAVQYGLGAGILPLAAATPAPAGTRLVELDRLDFAITVGLATPVGVGGRFGRPLAQAFHRLARSALLRVGQGVIAAAS